MLDFDDLQDKIPNSQYFSKIISDKKIYVDKTELIYKIARHDSFQFLSRPRRFGKSTIISILKELYIHGVKDFIDEDGIKQESYFKGLAIEKLWTEDKEYKVIHLDFSKLPDVDELIDEKLEKSDILIKRYDSYKVGIEVENFKLGIFKALKNSLDKNKLNITQNTTSFKDLLDNLIHQSKLNSIVLLIDEYDYPLTHPKENLSSEEYIAYENEVLAIMRSFYAIIKAQDKYFRKVFITGITRYKDASIFTAGNTIMDISLDPRFGAIVGFTRNEIKHYFYEHLRYAVMKHYAIDEKDIKDEHIEQILDKLAYWYDGFCFDRLHKHHVYSTISILQFFSQEDCAFLQYWYDLGGFPTILRANLDKILSLEQLDLITNKDQHIYDIEHEEFTSPTSYQTMNAYVLLYQCGYLTLADELRYGIDLKIPNFEIRCSLAALQKTKIFVSNANSTKVKITYTSNVNYLKELFNLIINASDYLKFRYDNEALVVQAIAIFLLAKEYFVLVEDVNAKGRRDLRIDFDNNKTLIFEFKFNKKNSSTSDDELLDKALTQIKDKSYNQIINREVRSFACVFNEEQRQISVFKELV